MPFFRVPRDMLSFTPEMGVATNRLYETACWRRLSKFGYGLLGRKQHRAVGVGSLEGRQCDELRQANFSDRKRPF
jgi:hypothetical protein